MNNLSAFALAGIVAMGTVWALKTFRAPSAPEAASLPQGGFLEHRYVLVAAAGACGTQADVAQGLIGGETAEAAVAESMQAEFASPSGASDAGSTVPPAAAVEVAAPEPVRVGGSCSGMQAQAPAEAGLPADEELRDGGLEGAAAPDSAKISPISHDLEPDPMPEPEPVSESKAEPASVAKPAPVREPKSEAKRSVVQPPKEPLTAWWPAPKAGALNVLFVGEASFGSAISVLTDGSFESAESANAHVEVRSVDGGKVDRRWQLATNKKMLLLVVKPGVYTVSIRSGLTDAQGRRMESESSGQVYVR